MIRLLLFVAQIVGCCSESAYARRAVREPPGIGIGECLTLGRHSFFEQFFGALFSFRIVIFDETCFQNGPNVRSVGSYFSEKV